MRISIILILLAGFFFILSARAYCQVKFDYPDNFRQSREVILDDDHDTTVNEADRAAYEFFFKPGAVFKVRTHPVTTPKKERKFKEPMNLWQIVLDRLKPENIFDFYPITSQLNTPQRLLTAVSMGYLMDNDRRFYTDIETGMRQSNFWKNNGSWLSSIADGLAEVGVAGALSLTGNKKNQQVAQMLMESALSLRIVYIKRVLGVTRPSELVSNIGLSHNYDSFPSGHTAVAFSMATILGEAYNLKWLTYPLALMSGLSRIQQNTHWTSDVFAGGLLGHLEARQILYRHGYISSDKIAESHVWDKTRVDIDGGYRVFYDSYSNIDSPDKILDRVGRLVWRYHITQQLSPAMLLQVNYHWRGQIPSIASYNSVEDVQVNPRLTMKLGSGTALLLGYTYNKVQFNDLGKSPHHSDVSQLPEGLDYIDKFGEKSSNCALLLRLSKDLMLKPEYSYSTYTYGSYSHLDSRGATVKLKLETSPERERKTDYSLELNTGFERARDTDYSFVRQGLNFDITHKLGERYRVRGLYQTEKRDYRNWDYGNYSPTAKWYYYGGELQRKFTDSWEGELGYYYRNLNSEIPGWAYRKNIYFLQFTNKF